MERIHGMTEQKRGRGRPKKIKEQAVYQEKAIYDWKDLAFKVQDALESSIQENKELEEKFQEACLIAIRQEGVIAYLETIIEKYETERKKD